MKRKNRFLAALTAAATAATAFAAMPITLPAQAVELVHNDFEINYGGWYAESPDWTAELTAVEGLGADGSRGMQITGRTASADAAVSEKDLYLVGGRRYDYSVRVTAENDQTFTLSLLTADIDSGEETVKVLDRKFVKGGTWAKLSASYKAPENSKSFKLIITTDTTDDFIFDDVSVRGREEIVASAAELGIKDMLVNYGIRSGNILNGSTVNDGAIKQILLKDCNAIECENETKPDATINQSGSSDDNVSVRDSSFAKIADWCAQNGLGFRGHTLIWHSQTPDWFFKTNFSSNGSWVDSGTMDRRMKSYIKNMFNLYATKYPNLKLYAYDVCNEVIYDGTANNGGARPTDGNGSSNWVRIYNGNSFVEKAFTYAREFAPKTCKLFYNDYNEFAYDKQNCIINTIVKPLFQKGLLDGMGMQSHVDCAATNAWGSTDSYLSAMDKYLNLGIEVQITELDLSTDGGRFSSQQQADKYKAIVKHIIEWNASHPTGGRVTLFQVWGPNDGHSWVGTNKAGQSNSPLLYTSDNQPKQCYSAITSLVPQYEWGDGTKFDGDISIAEPELNDEGYWFHYTFENGTEGFSGRAGSESLSSSSAEHYGGSKSLYVTDRTAAWHGAAVSLNSRIFKAGEPFAFSANVKLASGNSTETVHFTMQYTDADDKTQYVKIASGDVVKGEWAQLVNPSFTIPSGASNVVIYVECDGTTASYYVDDVIGAPNNTAIAGPGAPASLLIGDVTCDGKINGADLSAAKAGILSGKYRSSIAQLAADVDQSGEIDKTDISLLVDFLLGKIDEFPVAERVVNFQELAKQFNSINLATSYKKDNENNPLTTQRFGADPGWMVYKDRLYVYTTNDAFEYHSDGSLKTNSYDSGTINCVSSADLVNWTDHGAIPVADRNGRTTNGAAKWAYAAWAPDACWKTINGKDKFFLYFANSAGGIGVLTADSPTGPWTDPIGGPLITKQTANCSDVEWMFDPGVYYDPDTDTAYIAFGGGRANNVPAATPGTGRIAKLGKDMISLDGAPVKMQTPYLFEDSSLIKIGNTWYYSFCSNWNVPGGTNINGVSFGNADILYMTSTNPLGTWDSNNLKGNVFKNTATQGIDAGGNNHHSIIYFKGKYYVLYHSRQQAIRQFKAEGLVSTDNEGKRSSDGNYRSTQINEATFNPNNGTITCTGNMTGCSQLEYLNPYETVQAETMANQGGIQVSGVGDTVVTDINRGDWIKLKGVNFSKGCKHITVKASSANGAVIKVATGSANGDAFAYVEVPAGSRNAEITVPVMNSVSGANDICFVFSGEMEFDSWSFD